MRCAECKAEMVDGTTEYKRHLGGEDFVETMAAHVCAKGCEEAYVSHGEMEKAEHSIAIKLAEKGKTDPASVRFMLAMAGVHINEILLRFPLLEREAVKGWRRGEGNEPPPPQAIAWAYEIARLGYIPDCRCGECLGSGASTHPAA